jgi:hypothetical protein
MEGYRERRGRKLRQLREGLEKQEIKVKVKFTLEQATTAHRGSRGITLLFL